MPFPTSPWVDGLTRMGRLLSTDFCPGANRWVYWLKNPFWILVLALAGSVLCGLVLNAMVFLLSGLLVLVLLSGTILPWVMIRGVECRLEFAARRGRVGRGTAVRLQVRNRLPFPVWGLTVIRGFEPPEAIIAPGGEDAASADDVGVSLARVPIRATMDYTWSFVPRFRGAYPRGGVELETRFPFGLFRASRSVPVRGQLIVWPAVVRLSGIPDVPSAAHVNERLSEHRDGDAGDLTGTRYFRQGDPLRRIHWPQTARHQTLIVTERQAPITTAVAVAPDLRVEYVEDQEESESVARQEAVIAATASVCESLHRQHADVQLHLDGRRIVGDTSLSGLHRLMDALALAEPPRGRSRAADPGRIRTSPVIRVTSASANGAFTVSVSPRVPLADQLPREWRRVCYER